MKQGAVLSIPIEVGGQEAKRGNCAEECKGMEDVVVSSFHVSLVKPQELFPECFHHVFVMTEKKGVDVGKQHKAINKLYPKIEGLGAGAISQPLVPCLRGLHLTGGPS